MPEFQLVTPPAFDRLSDALAAEERIGLDTEFMRESTFHPELCLVQIATAGTIYCADPLCGAPDERGFTRFWQILSNRRWVVHSGRQDIEVLYRAAGQMPDEIFDTQIAAALLGYAPQLGYAALVAELFGIELAKSHTRADWSRRPLSPAVLEYAAEDVEYLLPACDRLVARLTELGRLEWAEQDSSDLLDRALYANDPAAAIQRLKGARNLRGRPRRIATSLAAWREREALRANRPRQWILKDAAVLDIAAAAPESEKALQQIPGLQPGTARRAGKDLLALVAAARDTADDYEPPARADERQKAQLKEMQARVIRSAADLGVVTEVIAPKKELAAALDGARNSRVFRGWRRELIGAELLEILGGDS